jgi:rhodanese-related sulfurtransferase
MDIKVPHIIDDVRSRALYDAEHIEDSIHCDMSDSSFTILQPYRLKKHIIIVAEGREMGYTAANKLVEKHYPFVSILHGGIEVVRKDNPSLLIKKK